MRLVLLVDDVADSGWTLTEIGRLLRRAGRTPGLPCGSGLVGRTRLMTSSPDSTRAALLLTNRLVPLDAKPLTAREFWQLVDHVDPADLVHDDAAAIAERVGVDDDEAVRLRTLLDAATALGFEQERLEDGGVSLVSALDDRFPGVLRDRLGNACPTVPARRGPVDWLGRPGLGVVGSRDADDGLLGVARRSAELAVSHGWPVVSGLARGVDQASMAGALDAGGDRDRGAGGGHHEGVTQRRHPASGARR